MPEHTHEIQQATSTIGNKFDVFGGHSNDGPNVATEIAAIMKCKSTTPLLNFWATRGDEFPILNLLARRYLSIPATSAPTERVFSSVKLFESHLRSRLSGDKVNSMVLARTILKHQFPTYFEE
jgi:hypothetical protein